ncbi:hypothetical protein ACLMJK_005935 [Lecanora helva]
MASSHGGVEMYQKGRVPSVFGRCQRPASRASDAYETEFEEDEMSDFEDYNGRTSEDSFGNRSNTTVSTFEELRTPASNNFDSFNFQLPSQEKPEPPKAVEGPVGPHLFRTSSTSSQEHDIYLDWSPVSPEAHQVGPQSRAHVEQYQRREEAPPSGVPFQAWTTQQVGGWMRSTGMSEEMVEKFRMHDISGIILKDLQFGDLKELGIVSFGQRHLLWNEIRKLRGALTIPETPADDFCHSPSPPIISAQQPTQEGRANQCSNPPSPDDGATRSPVNEKRRARRLLRPDDVISPGESASIVAIEQILPKPHHCSKGEDCSKWKKRQRKLERIMKEFPREFEQIVEANTAPSEITVRPISETVPSVVASSDLLGPGRLPALRINEEALKVVQTRDPQENVRQFLNFQHLDEPEETPTTPPYEMFPPLSPPNNTQAPHGNLSKLPKLTIPATQPTQDTFSPNSRTVIQQHRSPVTALQDRNYHDIYRFGSPASAMDVPVTAIPLGPIARDESQSVPPDMRYGEDPIPRSTSQTAHRQQWEPWSPITRPSTANPERSVAPISRSTSRASHRRQQPPFAMAPVEENTNQLSPVVDDAEKTPTVADVNHAGWMKKRKTKMLRHEWHEHHCRLNGTTLAMHRDSKTLDALEYIDVDEYAVACSSLASNKKLNTAFKSLKLGTSKKSSDKKQQDDAAAAFSFQLVPSAAEKKGSSMMFHAAATGKTHHFAVKTRDERIDWMRELMLAKALKQKADGCEINHNGQMM